MEKKKADDPRVAPENPVSNKRFFLEIKNSPHLLNAVSNHIKQLGGKIESFLNCTSVNYVVTNRPKAEWPQKTDVQASAAPIIANSNAVFQSRASKMLQSTQNVPKTTDPLEMARKFNKKIIYANDLLQFVKKHSPGTGVAAADGEKVHNTSEAKARKLTPPYIKVIDNSNRYRTNFKELGEWPEVNFEYQPELCPFFKPRRTTISNAGQSATVHGRPNDRFQTVLTTPVMTTPTLNINIKSIPTRQASKRKHMTFCEICHREYDDFEKHLNDELHSNFLNNDKNFAELFSVIQSLPPFPSNPLVNPLRTSRLSNKAITDITNMLPPSESPKSSHHHPHLQSLNDSLIGRKMPSPEMRSIPSINTFKSKHGHISIHDLVDIES